MTDSTETVRLVTRATRKTGRYALVGAEPHTARRLWIVLHGYAQLVPRFLRHFSGIVPPDTCVVAPEGLSRFYVDMPQGDGKHLQRVGATWMTRENREDDIADTLLWLDTVYHDLIGTREAPTIGLLAFSQGVATATRWLATATVRPHAFVAWAGGLAHDVDDEVLRGALRHAQVTLVRGVHDQLMSEAQGEALFARLQALAPHAAYRQFDGAHHLEPSVLAPLLDALSPSPDGAR